MTDKFFSKRFFPLNLTRENIYSGYVTHDPAQGRCHTSDHCSPHQFLPVPKRFLQCTIVSEWCHTLHCITLDILSGKCSSYRVQYLKHINRSRHVLFLLTRLLSAATRLFLTSHRALFLETLPGHEKNLYSGYATHDPAQIRCHSSDHCSLNYISSGPRALFQCTTFSDWSHALH